MAQDEDDRKNPVSGGPSRLQKALTDLVVKAAGGAMDGGQQQRAVARGGPGRVTLGPISGPAAKTITSFDPSSGSARVNLFRTGAFQNAGGRAPAGPIASGEGGFGAQEALAGLIDLRNQTTRKDIANIRGQTRKDVAEIGLEGTKFSAEKQLEGEKRRAKATERAAQTSAEARKEAAKTRAEAQRDVANIEKEIARLDREVERDKISLREKGQQLEVFLQQLENMRASADRAQRRELARKRRQLDREIAETEAEIERSRVEALNRRAGMDQWVNLMQVQNQGRQAAMQEAKSLIDLGTEDSIRAGLAMMFESSGEEFDEERVDRITEQLSSRLERQRSRMDIETINNAARHLFSARSAAASLLAKAGEGGVTVSDIQSVASKLEAETGLASTFAQNAADAETAAKISRMSKQTVADTLNMLSRQTDDEEALREIINQANRLGVTEQLAGNIFDELGFEEIKPFTGGAWSGSGGGGGEPGILEVLRGGPSNESPPLGGVPGEAIEGARVTLPALLNALRRATGHGVGG